MFDQTFVNAQAQTRRPWTVAISLALQTAFIAGALIVPLLHIASLDPPRKIPLWLPVQKLDLKMKPAAETARRGAVHLVAFRAPTTVPRTVDRSIDLSPEAPAIAESGPASFSGLPAEIAAAPPPSPPAPVIKPKALPAIAAPVVIGGAVQAAKLLSGSKPAYPPLARTTRTQGTVKIQAVIARDGSIRNLQLVSGPPLLVTVAMEAVRQWRYRPTLLNGEPVEVITEIDVNFTLSQ